MRNDGGPAFPTGEYTIVCGEKTTVTVPFISLRDYFAAAALTGYVMRDTLGTAEFAANRCYELADAMLREGQS